MTEPVSAYTIISDKDLLFQSLGKTVLIELTYGTTVEGTLSSFDDNTLNLLDVTLQTEAYLFNFNKVTVRFSVPIVFIIPSNLDGFTERITGTPLTASINFMSGPATPPGLGRGSVQLSVGANGAGLAELRQSQYDQIRLADLTALSYSTYVSAFGTGGQTPYILLDINFGVGTTIDEQLYFEPVYQPTQGTLTLNTWQTWNALSGNWHTGSGAPLFTLATYLTAHPDARIINSIDGGGLRIAAGRSTPDWDNFVGNFDQLIIGVSGDSVTYDFDTAVSSPGCR